VARTRAAAAALVRRTRGNCGWLADGEGAGLSADDAAAQLRAMLPRPCAVVRYEAEQTATGLEDSD